MLCFFGGGSSPNRTLDLASALDIGGSGTRTSSNYYVASGSARSVMTIAFEFACESHMQETVAALARQYVRTVISSVQKVASALSSNMNSNGALQAPLGTPEAHILARWISRSYSFYLGAELLKSGSERSENVLKLLWSHSDAIMCCSLKVGFRTNYSVNGSRPICAHKNIPMQAMPVFTFANQAGLDMLETTLVALQDISLEKVLDEHGRKGLFTEFAQIMQQVCQTLYTFFTCLTCFRFSFFYPFDPLKTKFFFPKLTEPCSFIMYLTI
ncbi:putative class III homeodomain-leucine zipper family [Helianthus debilis subsp. tardiflorus]